MDYKLRLIDGQKRTSRLVRGVKVLPRIGETILYQGTPKEYPRVLYTVTSVEHHVLDTKKVSTKYSTGDTVAKSKLLPLVTARSRGLEDEAQQT